MEEVTVDDFEEVGSNWLTANRNKVGPKTTCRRLTSLRAFARWAKWPVDFSDYSAPTPLKGQPHPLPEGISGVRAMIAAANNERHKALIALCGLCGLRIAEALAVRPSHFNLDDMLLEVRGKGDKTRMVPVSTEAWEVMQSAVTRAFCNGDQLVVGLKDRYARALVTELGERANLKRPVSSHDLRATLATSVFDKCLDQRVVQLILGHASGSTTELYIGRSAAQMREAVEL